MNSKDFKNGNQILDKEAFHLAITRCAPQMFAFVRSLDVYINVTRALNRAYDGTVTFKQVESGTTVEKVEDNYEKAVTIATHKMFALDKAFRSKGYRHIVTRKLTTFEEWEQMLDEADWLISNL